MKRRPLHRRIMPASWGMVAAYGAVLASGVLLMQWLDYQHYARANSGEIRMAILAGLFLGVGVWVGAQLFREAAPKSRQAPGNPEARAALGISDREYDVLELLAAGLSNKEIARKLNVSPNTVKTHVSRLLEKLEANRRTQAVQKARNLGLVR